MKNTPFRKDLLLFRKAYPYIIKYKASLLITFALIMAGIGLGLLQPLIWAKILNGMFLKNFNIVSKSAIYMMILFLLQELANFFRLYFHTCLSNNLVYDIKRDMYHSILNLPIKAFDNMRVGDFISRIQGDSATVAGIITGPLLNSLVDIFRVIILGVATFSINFSLALIVLVSFPFSFIIFYVFGKKLRVENKVLSEVYDDYYSNISQSLSGIKEIRSLLLKDKKFGEFLSLSNLLKNKNLHINTLNNKSESLSHSVSFTMNIAIILMGASFIQKGSLSLEQFIVFSSYSNQFSNSLLNLTKLNSNIQQALTSLERIFCVMDNLNYSKRIFGCKKIKKVCGDIKFHDVYFEYEKDSPILNGLSLHLRKRKKTAIVGISGSGKSTILNLLLRFYEPSSGRITIDDININEFDESSLLSNISIVRQEPFLFNTTIRDNLLFSNPSASNTEIYDACKKAYIHDYIMGLPQKYDTIIDDNGANLSGGQKQRIAIARALLKGSTILLFDEATSSLDNESQYYIKKAINVISRDHTIVIIAHRLSTIIESDEIILIHEGKVSGQGTHEKLLKENLIYKKLYKMDSDSLNITYQEAIE